MTTGYTIKAKAVLLWLIVIHCLGLVYFSLATYSPDDFSVAEKIAVAETKPVSEAKPESSSQTHKEGDPGAGNKSHSQPKEESGSSGHKEKGAESAVPGVTPEKTPLVQPEDIRAIMDTLERKRKALQEEEIRIKKERAGLDSIKQEIEEKIIELTAVQKKIEEDLNRKAALASEQEKKMDDAELLKIKQLVKVYSSMKPKSAAAIVDKMDMDIVFQVFSNMKGEQVGEILTYVDQDRAAKISEWLVRKERKK